VVLVVVIGLFLISSITRATHSGIYLGQYESLTRSCCAQPPCGDGAAAPGADAAAYPAYATAAPTQVVLQLLVLIPQPSLLVQLCNCCPITGGAATLGADIVALPACAIAAPTQVVLLLWC
jgi:hypothetical protein